MTDAVGKVYDRLKKMEGDLAGEWAAAVASVLRGV